MLALLKIFHKEILQITDQKFGYLDNCLSKQASKQASKHNPITWI